MARSSPSRMNPVRPRAFTVCRTRGADTRGRFPRQSVTAPQLAVLTCFAYLREHAAGVARLGGFPLARRAAISVFGMSRVSARVLASMVMVSPFLDHGDGAAERGFGCDVADDEAVAAAGEAAVRDERDVLAEALGP